MYQLSFKKNVTKKEGEFLFQLGKAMDLSADMYAAELGASPGTMLPTEPTSASPCGSPMSSPMSATSTKSEIRERPIFKGTLNFRTLALWRESKELLEQNKSIWKYGVARLHKPLIIATNQVERAIANLERFERIKVQGMISTPSSSISNPEPSTSWNLWNNTSLPTPGTTDSLVCTETFDEDIPLTPRTPRNESYGTAEIQVPERPQKPCPYFAPSSPGMPYISDRAPPGRLPGSLDSLWNTLV